MTEQTDCKTPKIRFKSHSETWKTASVSSLLTERNVQAPKSEQYPLMAFIAGQGVAPKGKRYNREFLVSDEFSKKYKRTELGDFIYSSNNLETGSIGTNNYGSASISPVYSIFSPTLEGDSGFIGHLLCKKAFINEMVKWRQGVVYGQWRIHESDFLKIKATFPTVDEQTQIGEYFRELDRLIELHQRKHDKLVTLKKAMLQKMFPQPGATTPEIRFKGFSEAWKEKELGELVNFFKGKGLSKSEIDPSGTEPCIHYGQLFTEYSEVISNVISRAKGGNSYFRSIANDVLMPTSDVTPRGLAKASAINESDVIIGGDILVIRGDKKLLLGSFLSRYIRYMESQVLQMVSGSTVFHLYSSSMEKFRVKYPSVSEQQKIGSYFRTLDKLISKHASQLQKLKQIKSACLEKMFV